MNLENNMSTNEQNKTQEINKNGDQIINDRNTLGKILPNSVESEKNLKKRCEDKNVADGPLLEEEDTAKNDKNNIENVVEDKENNQSLSREDEDLVGSEDLNLLTNTESSEVASKGSVSSASSMSRSNIKSRLPNKTTSRSALPHNNSKVPGELSGQPSVKNTKDDIKYWKNREQELLSKIAELESKASQKDSNCQKSINPVTTQPQEKLENDLVTGIKEKEKEKENHKNRQQSNERESNTKQIEIDSNFKNIKSSDEIINHLKLQNEDLRNALAKMTAILRDKTTMCVSQEKKIAALVNQVESLKEVVAITKDLLNIRNMEVQHLSNDISAMETKIDCERQRHNQMLTKMDEAVKLNSELKKEYENQLKLFQHLRDSYEEKIILLSRDNNEKKESMKVSKENANDTNSNPSV